MSKNELEKSLQTALEVFQSKAGELLDKDNLKKSEKERIKLLEEHVKPLVKQFLYGGYINVSGMVNGTMVNRKIYFNAIELYYHECEKAGVGDNSRITDYIMYHIPELATTKLSNDWTQSVLPQGALHIHQSGVDITFEDPKDRFRASILIREFIVVENNDYSKAYTEVHPTFIKHELLEEIPIHIAGEPLCIQWIDVPSDCNADIEPRIRVHVPKCDLAERKNGTLVRNKKNGSDGRSWHFRRKTPLSAPNKPTLNKSIKHLELFQAFDADADKIVTDTFELDEIFSSHQFIQKFTQDHHIAYVKALNYYLTTLGIDKPINKLHGDIAIALKGLSRVRKVGKIKSDTIFGDKRMVVAWKRIY